MRLPTRYSRLTGAAAAAAGLMILASGCASGAPHQASGTGARPQQTTATVAPRPPAPTPSASRPVPTASPATGSTSAAYTGPHFTTPQAAMTYLAAAYNSDDATAMHAVTDAQAFTSLQAMRLSGVDLQLVSCTPRQQGTTCAPSATAAWAAVATPNIAQQCSLRRQHRTRVGTCTGSSPAAIDGDG